MIRSIRVKNFKTLRDVTLPLAEKVTVFVGANNSGKTNALTLMDFMAATVDAGVEETLKGFGGMADVLTRGSSSSIEYEVEAEFNGRQITYGLRAGGRSEEWLRGMGFDRTRTGDHIPLIGPGSGDGKFGDGLSWWGREGASPPETHALYKAIAEFDVSDLSPDALREPSVVKRAPELGSDGSELASVLDAQLPKIRDAIDKEVSRAAPDVRRVLTLPADVDGQKIVGIEETSGEIYGADHISDGLLLFIGLSTALQMKQTRKTIVAVEEPERGIHPRRLEQLVDQLWRLTEGGTQVVLTTHSPLLLDQFRDYPESVVIFDRQGADTRVTRLVDNPAWKDALELDVKALGDIWYSGVLGGVPPP